MPEFHAEPYIYLPAVTHKSALVAWGAFYFRTTSRGKWKIVDDHDLKYVHPPRKDSIGALSAPYGPARVEVYDKAGVIASVAKTEVANHCWLPGLKPDTEYTYKVFVKDEEWAAGERWDWSAQDSALVQAGNSYDNRFCTNPDPTVPAGSLSFAVMGDFGVGVKRDSPTRRQQKVANAIRRTVDTQGVRLILTTGDNIYAGTPAAGDSDWRQRRRRRRLVLHLLPAVSLCDQPRAGVSLDREPRRRRDRRAGRSRAGRRQLLPARTVERRRRGRRPRLILSGVVLPLPLRVQHRVRVPRYVEGRVFPWAPPVRISQALGVRRVGVPATITARACGAFRFATIRRTAPDRSTATPKGWSASFRCSIAPA